MMVDLSAIAAAMPYLLNGLWFTVQITLVGVTGGIVFGSLLAVHLFPRDCRRTGSSRPSRPLT
jgi:glutamate/aspartate transport system permease protein